MRRVLIILAALLGLLAVFFIARAGFMHASARRAGIHVGLERHQTPQAAPALTFLDENGQTRTLDEWRGQALLVNLWGTWCPPCRREMPALERLAIDFDGKGLRVMTIHLDRPGSLAPAVWLSRENLTHLPAFHANGQSLLRGVNSQVAPTTLILNRQGEELARITGGANWNDERLRTLLAWAALQ